MDDIVQRFEVSKRTGQRMLRALEAQFPDTSVTMDDEGHKRWHLSSGALRDLMSLFPEELAALDLAIESLKRSSLTVEAEDLLNLREKWKGTSVRTSHLCREPYLAFSVQGARFHKGGGILGFANVLLKLYEAAGGSRRAAIAQMTKFVDQLEVWL